MARFSAPAPSSAGEDCDRADEKETDAHDEHSPIHIRSSGQGRILSFFGNPQVGILYTRIGVRPFINLSADVHAAGLRRQGVEE